MANTPNPSNKRMQIANKCEILEIISAKDIFLNFFSRSNKASGIKPSICIGIAVETILRRLDSSGYSKKSDMLDEDTNKRL